MRHLPAIILCTALATFMGRLDTNIVAISLPAIADHLQVSAGAASNLMLYYLLTISVLLIPLGKLGDRVGFRVLLLAGYAVFTGGSLLCGLAGSLGQLTAARSLQGGGAALMLISAYSLIPRLLPLEKVGGAMGALSTAGSIGIMVGAPLGGVLTEWLSWRSIFLINIPVGAVALWIACRSLPSEPPREEDSQPLDWYGCILGAGWVLLIILGLDHLRDPEKLWEATLLLGSGLILLALFVHRLRHAERPLFDPKLFANPEYNRALGVQGLMFLAIAAHGFALPFYLDRVLGLSHQNAGLVLALFPVGVSVVAPLSGRLADRYSPTTVLAVGVAGNALATLLLAVSLHAGVTWAIYPYLPVMGACFGTFLAPSGKLLLAGIHHGSQGAATSIFHTINNVALTFGVAVSALMLTWSGAGKHMADRGTADFFPLYAALACLCLLATYLAGRNLTASRRKSDSMA